MAETSESFTFEAVEKVFITQKEHQQCLFKWGLEKTLKFHSFRFNLSFQEVESKQFIKDFVNDPVVRHTLNSLGLSGQIDKIDTTTLRASTTNMSLFDRLENEGIIARGSIKGTYDDYVEGIHIQSLLKEMMLKEESEYFEIYSEEEKKQLLYNIFFHMVIGGSMSQPDDQIENYLDISKNIYKNLVNARKDQGTNKIFIDSFVYKINSIEGNYPNKEHPMNGFYLIVNPSLRTCNVMLNKWEEYW